MPNDKKQKIKDAVAQLDRKMDGDWTTSGLPSVARVQEMVGEPVTREEINDAASGSMREKPAPGGGKTPRMAAADVPEHGGGMVFDDREGALVEADAASEMRATHPRRKELEDDFDGPDPEHVFGLLDELSAAASSPRWKRNQILQQIKQAWAQGQDTSRKVQEKLERRTERRIEHRERVREDKATAGAQA